jgi:uncharacterized membrane protein YidH (DUF202 family)
VEQFAPSLTVACPAHGGPDHVRRVSAVYGEAATATPARLLLSAERLAWVGTALGVLGAVLLSVRAALKGGGGAASVPLLVAAIVCFGYAVACYGLAYARRVGAFLVRRPPPREEERAVWYCERCNAVFTAG